MGINAGIFLIDYYIYIYLFIYWGMESSGKCEVVRVVAECEAGVEIGIKGIILLL